MKKTKPIRLTKIQREVLEALRGGEIIRIDRSNMPLLGNRCLSPQTRYFLTDNRLVERRDKTRSVESDGNGFVLSAKGLAILESLPPGKQAKDTTFSAKGELSELIETRPQKGKPT